MLAAQGYTWYYLSGDIYPLWLFGLLALVGLGILIHKNSRKVPEAKKRKVILFDALHIGVVAVLVSIPMPFLAWLYSAFMPLAIIQYGFKPFGQKRG